MRKGNRTADRPVVDVQPDWGFGTCVLKANALLAETHKAREIGI
jgi:hypothetical protein